MEDVQHYNESAHNQQHGHGQRDDQVDEVFICRCRHRGIVSCHSVHKLLISVFFLIIQLEVWGVGGKKT